MPAMSLARTAGAALGKRSAEVRRERAAIVKRLVAETRRRQGLPSTITDNAVLERLAEAIERGEARQ